LGRGRVRESIFERVIERIIRGWKRVVFRNLGIFFLREERKGLGFGQGIFEARVGEGGEEIGGVIDGVGMCRELEEERGEGG